MDASQKISGGLFISGGDSSEFLELAHEILDQMACFVHLFVESARRLAIALGRDHRGFARRQKGRNYPLIGVEGFISQQDIGFHLWQQRVGTFQIVRLTSGEEERKRIAQCIDHKMDFCAQPAFAAPDRLVFAVFFWAPALC
jgi:hypothetical protein